MDISPARRRLTLALLTLVYVANFVDRQLVGILGQPMKLELGLSDTQLALLGGTAFALFYTALGLPIARMAERRPRARVVAGSLALWSAMTALCGLARGFPALLLARIGVGVGEAGCVPPSQSLIADLYPPDRRATALSLFSLGVPLGMLIGAVAGGWIGQTLGWRIAFVALGMPGLALAVLVALVLREPPRPAGDAPPAIAAVLRGLIGQAAVRHMVAGATLASMAGYGITSFAVPLLTRRYGLSLGEAASGFGLVVGSGMGIGIGFGGWLSDRIARSWAPGIVAAYGTVIAFFLFHAALEQASPARLIVPAAAGLLAAHLYFGPTYAVVIGAAPRRARATAIALLLLAMNALGLGLGPFLTGMLSDRLAAGCGVELRCSGEGLRSALGVSTLLYGWAALHFLLAARAHCRQDQSASL